MCLWRGPENLLEKITLATASAYRNSEKIRMLFTNILSIRNANWTDYHATLLELKRSNIISPNVERKVLDLYKLLSLSILSDEDSALLLTICERECLVYAPQEPFWFAPSECLWTSPVPVPDNAILHPFYPESLRDFFQDELGVSPASIGSLVGGLISLAEGQPSVTAIKSMIVAINAMNPQMDDLSSLRDISFLPVKSSGSITLQSRESNFCIIDRTKLAEIFRPHTGLLDFTLEEVRSLAPFLNALELRDNDLSWLCVEQTACSDEGVVDPVLTQNFARRAPYLVRCAVSNRTPLVVQGNYQNLYQRLLDTSVSRTEAISTEYTIRYQDGEIIGPITLNTGHVHIQEHGNGWQIFVPRSRNRKEICYMRELPNALASLFEIDFSAEAPYTSDIESIYEDQDEDEEEITPSSRNSGQDERIQISTRSVSAAIPERNEFARTAYGDLLNNVIQIARRASIPDRNAAISGPGQFHPGHIHNDAFGVRSQGQMNHDVQIGAAGELFVYELLANFLSPSFGWSNWTSTINSHILIHPDYSENLPWPGRRETSDIRYVDRESVLTMRLISTGYLNGDIWAGKCPEYFIEVKTTTGNCNDRFFMSNNQYSLMQEMELQGGNATNRIYVVFRVYNLGRDTLNVKVYVDPEAHRRQGTLAFAQQTWTVVPVLH
ncbi:hypothetical protein HYFRA_00004281 [Hymenoscyphus fraxineus]|uniref:Protein NO VEIN C-terminal domain-containing protein n=1 Tax=Hymenoscyphus fraxineus TaxID=746836 RepID=A0A9N9KPW4_9HELO|nr:hypothetical protein HYFRA_00004281 [Hymenoscyphus fraxineus]